MFGCSVEYQVHVNEHGHKIQTEAAYASHLEKLLIHNGPALIRSSGSFYNRIQKNRLFLESQPSFHIIFKPLNQEIDYSHFKLH